MHEKPTLSDINEVNKKAYEALARKYSDRKEQYVENDIEIVGNFTKDIDEGFPGTEHAQLAILDVGVGSGLNLGMFNELGYKTYGSDFSDRMIMEAKKESPNTLYYHGDFFGYRFARKFHGIMAKAFIHLFPENIARQIVEKIRDSLEDKGVLFLATTMHDEPREGMKEKEDFNEPARRYRKQWTKEEFQRFLGSIKGLTVVRESEMTDPLGKRWMNFTLRKTAD